VAIEHRHEVWKYSYTNNDKCAHLPRRASSGEIFQQKLTGVPAHKVDKMVAMFKAEGASDVQVKREADGSFAVITTFPD
jgi:hypothetical protein